MVSRSRTSSSRSSAILVAVTLALLAIVACGQKQDSSVAQLAKAEGPVEREVGEDGKWTPAPIGQKFNYGDAARTGDGNAYLGLRGGGASIKMLPATILRFGGGKRGNRLFVEGTIDLSGTGTYALDVGEVKLSRGGTVRITSKGDQKSSIELTIGEAQVTTTGGTIDLVIGKAIDVEVSIDDIVVRDVIDASVPVDAAVVDADVVDAAELDAGVAAEGTIEVAGKKAEIQLAGEKWKPLPAGAAELPPGAAIRLGQGTTAKIVARGVTLELAGAARLAIGADYTLTVENGTAVATTETAATVKLPGGAVVLDGKPQAAAAAQVVVGPRDTKVKMLRGGGKLAGANAEQTLARGESATLLAAGSIRVNEAIPTMFDFRITAGETLTIHDPRPPAAVQFMFGGKCPNGGIVEMDSDFRFRSAKVSAGKEHANLYVGPGSWAYRLRCTTGGTEGAAIASGRIALTRDSGTRALPKIRPPNDIEVDGRTWRVSYQSVVPDLRVNVKGAGSKFRLHVAQGGQAQTFDSSKPTIVIPGNKLKDGTYTYWVERDGVKLDKVSTLIIDFDQTAAQVYIEAPRNNASWGSGDIEVRGAVLPNWTASVEGIAIPLDSQRRFFAKVGRPPGQALAIKLSHPQRGTHYYLRRSK